jgi:hypothetical protein
MIKFYSNGEKQIRILLIVHLITSTSASEIDRGIDKPS